MQPRFAERVSGMSSSAIREIFKHLGKPGLISFAGGNPGAFALPDAHAAALAERLLRENGKALLQYGQTEGWLPLRESLVGYLQATIQLKTHIDRLLITTGSMQGLDLLCRTLLDPGDTVLCESPVFLGALQALNSYQANVLPVPCDDDGMDVDALERLMKTHQPKLLYTIPTFQNPTGRTLSLARRKRVAQLAAAHRVVVAEDDPYAQLRYRGDALPAISAFDSEGWVIFLGSFSKVISPGLRVGFMCGHPEVLHRCVQFKQCSDVHTANLNQAMVDAFLRRDLLNPHIARIVPVYRDNLDIMLEELAAIPQVASFSRPDGGLFIFATLLEGIDANALFPRCLEQGVAFVPGTSFFPESGHTNTLRLNFSNAQPDDIRRGMRIMARCLAHH